MGIEKSRQEGKGTAMRLNKYIAAAGICSRRKADELIANGNVKVNGAVVQQMGVDVGEDDVVMVEREGAGAQGAEKGLCSCQQAAWIHHLDG